MVLLLFSLPFSAKEHMQRQPDRMEWYTKPDNPNGACMILISGKNKADSDLIEAWGKDFSSAGIQCVGFACGAGNKALKDAETAISLVRNQAVELGLDPERIGVAGVSGGARIAMLLAAGSKQSCHINWAVVKDPARLGSRHNSKASPVCPVFLDCSGNNISERNGVVSYYTQLRRSGIPAEMHFNPRKTPLTYSSERILEFLIQMGFLGTLKPEEAVLDSFDSGSGYSKRIKERLWPEGRIPDMYGNQAEPYMEWFFPEVRKSGAVQILYSGGAYNGCNPDSFEVVPVRLLLNEMGVTVVVLRYRTPRPAYPMEKHISAWQDLQRAVRLVRSHAEEYGLDAGLIGIMGSSAGGHLTLMGVTSSMRKAYDPVDETDSLGCNVRWGIAIYPAYVLSDGIGGLNTNGGNDDSAVLVPEFGFDCQTVPMLFIHGDSDGYSAMGSVKAWEKLNSMGLESELHTLATRGHCFQQTASPGTGSYNWVDRVWDFVLPYVYGLN